MAQPLYSIESEKSVIGALLLNNGSFDAISDVLTPTDFYVKAHVTLYREISVLLAEGKTVDVIILEDHLRERKLLDEVGGLAYIAEVVRNTPTSANISSYAKTLKKRSILRHLQQSLDQSNKFVSDNLELDPEDILEEVEKTVLSVKDLTSSKVNDIYHVKDILTDVLNDFELYSQNSTGITGLATGYKDLDKLTTGLHPGEMIIVAGRPSMGKTTLAMNIAENVLKDSDKGVLLFSLEMTRNDIVKRLCSSVGKVDYSKIRSASFDGDGDWSKITAGFSQIRDFDLHVIDTRGLTPNKLKHNARKFKRENPNLGLIVIDYLQLLTVPGLEMNRNLEVSKISESIKQLAGELGVPIIAIAQLNRSVDERRVKKPMMSDLRDSGAIEQDADLILFVYREEVYEPDKAECKGRAEVIIGKQRNGSLGSIDLTFRGEYCRFENMALNQYANFLGDKSIGKFS